MHVVYVSIRIHVYIVFETRRGHLPGTRAFDHNNNNNNDTYYYYYYYDYCKYIYIYIYI